MASSSPRETLELMLGHLGFVFEIEEKKTEAHTVLNIKTRETGRLIGREGRTLDDLQHLLNRLLWGTEEAPQRVIVDVENYREKNQNEFMHRIEAVAARVKSTGKGEALAPMNSYDRWLLHQAFAEDPHVRTRSEEAEGRLKRIILEPRTPNTAG